MTERDIFFRVRDHLLNQNEKATDEQSDRCQYRAYSEGRRLSCAIGCLIPEDLYDHRIEGCAMYSWSCEDHALGDGTNDYKVFRRIIGEVVGELTESKLLLLRQLQDVHDDNQPERWEYQLQLIAEERGF